MHQASAFKLKFYVYDVQNATYSSHGAPCTARDLFPWLNTRVKVHISVWAIREYPKRHSSYLSDSGIPSYHWEAMIDKIIPVFGCLYREIRTISKTKTALNLQHFRQSFRMHLVTYQVAN